MSSTILVVKHASPLNPGGTASPTRGKRELLRRVVTFLVGALSGIKKVSSFDLYADGSADPVAASGTLTLSTASGAVGGTINGVTITATAAGGDTATAALIAAAINASTNALVQYIVTASSSGAVVTITAAKKGATGNCITLAASGTGVTASGARLTGGAGGNVAGISVTL